MTVICITYLNNTALYLFPSNKESFDQVAVDKIGVVDYLLFFCLLIAEFRDLGLFKYKAASGIVDYFGTQNWRIMD